MKIDLGDKTDFEVSYNGKVYHLREPNGYDIENYQSLSGSEVDQDTQMKEMYKLLADLGLPEEVGKDLGISKLQKLTEHLFQGSQEKK